MAARDAFVARHRVILFDNRGAGESEAPPPPWTVTDMAADAVGVLDALGIERAHVLGVSMGGMIAQEMAIRWPDRIDRLVVAMSFGRPDPIRRAFPACRWARLQGADLVQEGVANLPWLVSPRVLNDGDRLEQLLAIVGTMPMMVPEAYSHQIDAILEHDTVSRLHHVRARRSSWRPRKTCSLRSIQRGDRRGDPGARPAGPARRTRRRSRSRARSTRRCWSSLRNKKTPMAIAATRRPVGEAGTIGVRWLPAPGGRPSDVVASGTP